MRLSEGKTKVALGILAGAVALALAGCGGSSSSSSSTSSSSPPQSTANNTMDVQVNSGPANDYVNGIFTSVTICVPGTSTCQTIPNVLVDTGSAGLRLLSSAVTLSLPAVKNSSGNALQECAVYGDGSYNWGPVVSADIELAGEKGSSVPIQLIANSNTAQYPVPSACSSGGGPNEDTVQSLGANGVLGIGIYQQDCGASCAASAVSGWYYLCQGSSCQATAVPLQDQLQNPVSTFSSDNNGVLISLPSVPADGSPSVSGSLVFGVGTQSDNALGNAQVYTVNDSTGNINSTYKSTTYPGFLDSGSNGLYFLDSGTLGIPDCTNSSGNSTGWYCPGSTQTYTVTNTGQNQTSNSVKFNIANADALFSANNSQNWAFNDLGGDSGSGPSTDFIDFGLPFFFGRNVFIGIENTTGPNGVVGPYWAY